MEYRTPRQDRPRGERRSASAHGPIGGADWGDVDDAASLRALHAAADAGVTLIDTADVYGDGRSERVIRRFLAGAARRAVLRRDQDGPPRRRSTRRATRPRSSARWLDRSRENLGVETIDLVQLHCPPTQTFYYRPSSSPPSTSWSPSGSIAAYGVSVEKVEEALKAIEFPGVATVQIIFNMFRQRPAERFLAEARAARRRRPRPRAARLRPAHRQAARGDTAFEADGPPRCSTARASRSTGARRSRAWTTRRASRSSRSCAALVPAGATLAQAALRWILEARRASRPRSRAPRRRSRHARTRPPRTWRRCRPRPWRASPSSTRPASSPSSTSAGRQPTDDRRPPRTAFPGAVLTEREHQVPLDHARPDGPTDHRLHPRGRGPRWPRPPVSRVPPGRPGFRGDPAHEPADRAG